MLSRPEIVGTFGVVTSTHWLATAAGMSILEKGGNAFDAAVAAGCVLHIVEPDQNGPGGDVPIILRSAAKDRVEVICGQGVAPGAMSAGHLRDLGHDVMPGIGHLPAVVPGSFGAWMLLLREYGSLTVRDVLEPAIEIASNGFNVKPDVEEMISACAQFMTKYWPSSAEVFLPAGSCPQAGTIFKVPAQAETYTRLIQEAESAGADREEQIEAARRAWYEGFVAEAIDKFMREPVMDTSGECNAGLLDGQDLTEWRAEIEAPVTYDYGEYTVCKAGPWSQGPVMLQQLALLEGFDLASMDPSGPDFVHTIQECAKLAFADREVYYGDPKFVDVPMGELLSHDYNTGRRHHVGEQASMEMRPGAIEGFGGSLKLRAEGSTNMAHGHMSSVGESESTLTRSWTQYMAENHGDTCHFDIIDRWGNMVSATPSGGWLNGSPVVPGLGFCVSTRGQMFWLDDEHPNGVAPRKRPRTTLTPSLALKAGVPYLAFGTPGGDQQDQWALHAFLRHVHHGMNLQEACDAPAFYSLHVPSSFYPREWTPGHLAVEEGFPHSTIAALNDRGHQIEVYPQWGQYNSITMATRRDGVLRAGASPRRACYAIGR